MNRDNEQERRAWALVHLPAGQAKAYQFMQCLERLLRATSLERVLLLAGSAALLSQQQHPERRAESVDSRSLV